MVVARGILMGEERRGEERKGGEAREVEGKGVRCGAGSGDIDEWDSLVNLCMRKQLEYFSKNANANRQPLRIAPMEGDATRRLRVASGAHLDNTKILLFSETAFPLPPSGIPSVRSFVRRESYPPYQRLFGAWGISRSLRRRGWVGGSIPMNQ